MKRKASIATAAVFLAVLFGFSLLHLALPDREISRSERRRLAQLPPLSSGFSDKLEEYMLDQFPLREQLRTVNSLVRLYGLGQADIHGIYLQGGGAFRMDGPLQEKQVRHAAAVFSAVQETYFPSLPSHYVIVPDKNAKAETSRPRLDTEALRGIVRDALPGMTEIDIWDLLSADDYYKTDPHWRQERLLPVAAAICEALGADAPGTFTEKTLSPFYGAYYGQAALPMAPDTLTYLESADTKAAKVTGPELDGAQPDGRLRRLPLRRAGGPDRHIAQRAQRAAPRAVPRLVRLVARAAAARLIRAHHARGPALYLCRPADGLCRPVRRDGRALSLLDGRVEQRRHPAGMKSPDLPLRGPKGTVASSQRPAGSQATHSEFEIPSHIVPAAPPPGLFPFAVLHIIENYGMFSVKILTKK